MSRFLSIPLLLLSTFTALAFAGAPATAPATAPAQVRYVQMQNTNAADAAGLLNTMFRSMGPVSQAATQARPMVATADARTNTVVLTGPADRVAHAADLLQKMDQVQGGIQPTSVFFIYHLQHAHAQELAALMNQCFGPPAAAPNTATAPSTKPAATSWAAALAAGAYFVPNPDTNSLLVTTDTFLEDTVRTLLTLLDRSDHAPPPAKRPSSSRP
jgi:type II secretory pathway component GspD/PulD (secretin)